MADVNPDTLLEWLNADNDDSKEMQLLALEQLCMTLLMTDSVERCFQLFPPSLYLPVISNIFLDETTPDEVLEVAARAITYYLDVSAECTKRIAETNGVLKAMCDKLILTNISSQASKELAEQCCKVLELVCIRESGAVFDADGLGSVLFFVNDLGSYVHKDALRSAMSVVSRLCAKIEPNDPSLNACVESLSEMLRHEDINVSDGALKCFVSICNRFSRGKIDPATLVQHGLLDELIIKLSAAGRPIDINAEAPGFQSSFSTITVEPTQPITVVVNLIITLCRGSKSISHNIFRSDLSEAIKSALRGDEKCRFDTMRLVDLLLILLLEGHEAIAWRKLSNTSNTPEIAKIQHTLSDNDKFQNSLINYIRHKDNKAIIEALNSRKIDINHVDDVGQTLLNWASAFGTPEMVEFLISKGADVNKGLRSSSLHYAACFGRTAIVQILLKHGANPVLRDDEGKTPLDKAQEKITEGHREVVAILKSSEWLMSHTSDTILTKGDPEMAEIYFKELLPAFCHTFKFATTVYIKKTSLSLIKRMVNHIKPDWLKDACKSDCRNKLAPLLVDVLATVLDNEDDEEGHVTALQAIYDLLVKCQDIFLEEFAALGVFYRVQQLIGPDYNFEKDTIRKIALEKYLTDENTKEVTFKQPYHWNDWFFIYGRGSFYAWNEYTILELSKGSNGWFRFLLNDNLSTMYSNGSYKLQPDMDEHGVPDITCIENKTKFVEDFLKIKSHIKPHVFSERLLDTFGTNIMIIGNWIIKSKKENELIIKNSDNMEQIITLKSEKVGFSFQTNQGAQNILTGLLPLEKELTYGWKSIIQTNVVPSVSEIVGQQIRTHAQDIYDKFFEEAQAHPRSVVIKLNKIVTTIESVINNQSSVINDNSNKQSYASTLNKAIFDLTQLLMEDESSISPYEIYSSGLVEVLLQLITPCNHEDSNYSELEKCGIDIFVKCFKGEKNDKNTETYAFVLVQKLISVLESIEKLPVYSYGPGLQVITKRLKFRLERAPGELALIDRTGKGLKIEPLNTIYEIEKYLLKKVTRQWFDYQRPFVNFIRKFKDINAPMEFRYEYDFDENGVLYWIGTNGKTVNDYVNPGICDLVLVQSSDGRNLPYGKPEDILNRDPIPINCHTHDDINSWFSIDLGLWIIPTNYTLKHARGFIKSALRNWLFQMSKDGIKWTTLYTHTDDTALNLPGNTATWSIQINNKKETKGWRHVRIKQNGKNESGQTYYLSLSGFEIYGTVTGICEQFGETDIFNKNQLPMFKFPTINTNNVTHNTNSDTNRRMLSSRSSLRINSTSKSNSAPSLPEASYDSLGTDEPVASTMRINNSSSNNSSNITMAIMPNSAPSLPVTSNNSLNTDDIPVVGTSNIIDRDRYVKDMFRAYSAQRDSNLPFGAHRVNIDTALGRTFNDITRCPENLNSYGLEFIPVMNSLHSRDTNNSVRHTLQVNNPLNNDANSQTRDQSTSTSNNYNINRQRSNNTGNFENMAEETGNTSSNYINTSISKPPNIITYIRDDSNPNPIIESLTAGRIIMDPRSLMASEAGSLNLFRYDPEPTHNANNVSHFYHLSPNNMTMERFTLDVHGNMDRRTIRENFNFEELLDSDDAPASFAELDDEDVLEFDNVADDESDDIDEHEIEEEQLIPTRDVPPMDEEEFDTNPITVGENVDIDSCTYSHRRRLWDDDYILRKNFTELIPPFDPRPGSINFNQTSDLKITPPPENENDENCVIKRDSIINNNQSTRLKLTLKGPNMPGIKNVKIELNNSKWTIFHAIQKLAQLINFGSRLEKSKRIWEPTYTIIYEELRNKEQNFFDNPDDNWDSDLPILDTRTQYNNKGCTVDQVLQLLRELHNLSINPSISLLKPFTDDFFEAHKIDDGEIMISANLFNSKKITNKLVQQIHDPLVLSSGALPSWCEKIITSYPFLFSFDTRFKYFNSTAFGSTKAIVWLQNQRESRHVVTTNSTYKREDEYIVGRLKHDRVRIPRDENILAWSRQLMRAHIDRQTPLEVEFIAEEGTGLGPTLEFYSLVAAEFQRKDLCMWNCSDKIPEEIIAQSSSSEENAKPPDYYAWQSNGLYPAPLPQNALICDKTVKHFWYFGMFLAKVLQDNRLIDLPLSLPFLKLFTKPKNNESSKMMNISDLFDIDERLGMFIKNLKKLILSKEEILLDPSLNDEEKHNKVQQLQFEYSEMGNVFLKDLCLVMVYLPSSSCFPFSYINLIDDGYNKDVDMDNVEQYVNLLMDLILNTGIKRQMDALRDGFNRVFPIEKLSAFTPLELRQMICGQQEPKWTREDLLNYTVPKLGYNKTSPGYIRLINVLEQMNSEERKSFLQFITGCSSLPPGGLANLYPRLTVVRTVDASIGSYPSVNTCVHYLKLPEYPDEEILKDRLFTATLEKGFHLN